MTTLGFRNLISLCVCKCVLELDCSHRVVQSHSVFLCVLHPRLQVNFFNLLYRHMLGWMAL